MKRGVKMFRGLLIFLLGIVVLFAANSAFAKMMESKKPRLSTKEQRLTKVQKRIIELNKKLNLDEQQRRKITDILTQNKEEVVRLLEETGEKIKATKAAGEQEIEKVLAKEQRDKFNNVYEKEEEDEDVVKVFKSNY